MRSFKNTFKTYALDRSDSVHLSLVVNVQAEKLNSSGMEVAYRLPLTASASFPALLGEVDLRKDQLGITNYGLSVTTLEEVFLKSALCFLPLPPASC